MATTAIGASINEDAGLPPPTGSQKPRGFAFWPRRMQVIWMKENERKTKEIHEEKGTA